MKEIRFPSGLPHNATGKILNTQTPSRSSFPAFPPDGEGHAVVVPLLGSAGEGPDGETREKEEHRRRHDRRAGRQIEP